ncbi:MAG: serine hydrolase [Kaistella sp.]
MTVLFFMLLHLTVFSQNQKTVTDKRLNGLDATFNKMLKDWHIAGFAVAVVEKNKIIYSKGFGYRDLEKKLPVDGNTLFAIGSCSKAFTAALTGQLVNEGKLDLDKPITSYFPNLRFYNDNMNNMITARDMLSHRTGLPRHDVSWYLFPTESRDNLVKRIQLMEPSAPVREKWQYNNFMYMALGAVDEQMTGNTWDTNIKQKIFAPLHMTRSTTNLKDWKADSNSSFGYGIKKDSTIKKLDYYNIAAMSPAGAINSSVNEMTNWVTAWLNDGKFNGKEVIPASFRSEAISSQAVIVSGFPTKEKPDLHFSNYGFGWTLSSYKGHYRVEHGGNIDGFSASTAFFPTDSLGIIVLTNQDASSVPTIVRNLIADQLLGLKYFDWNADIKKSIAKTKAAMETKEKDSATKIEKPATHDLKDYVGDYESPGYGTMKIYLEKDSLYFMGGSKKIWLRHNNFDTFDLMLQDPDVGVKSTDEPMVTGQFSLETSGNISGFSALFEDGIKPIEFKKKLNEKSLSKEELQQFTGDYALEGMTVKIYIKNEKTLYALVPGQPEYELIAVDKDKFALKNLSGYFLQFNTAEKSATFIQPNGNFKAKKK